MTRRALAVTLLLACSTLAVPVDAAAQQRRAVTFDVSIGWGDGHTSGEYRTAGTGPVAGVLLAWSSRAEGRAGMVTGVSSSVYAGSFMIDDICIQKPGGGCVPTFPGFLTFGVPVGWESAGAALRAMGGPVYVRSDGTGSLGLEGRLEGALPIVRHLTLVASVRGAVIPHHRGDSFRLFAGGLGLRIR